MTFFLNEAQTPPEARGPDIALPTNIDGMGGAARQALRRVDAYLGYSAKRSLEEIEVATPAADRIGIDALNTWYSENGAGYDHLRPAPQTVDDFFAMHGDEAVSIIMNLARSAAETDPDAWADLDLTDEGIAQRVDARIQTDHAIDAANLALSPNPVLNGIVGSLGAGFVDPVNIALVPFGLGGGSVLRTMGREALLGALAEGIQYSTIVENSARLGEEAPDLLEALSMGAIGGAVIGGAFEVVPRAFRGVYHYLNRKDAPRIEGISPATAEAAVEKAADAISRDQPALDAAASVLRSEPAPDDFTIADIFGESRTRILGEVDPPPFVAPARGATAIPEPAPITTQIDTSVATENAARYSRAREADPEAFSALETAQKRQDTFRRWIAELGESQDAEVSGIVARIEAQESAVLNELASLRTGGRRRLNERLKQLRSAKEEALTLSARRETPDIAQVRRDLMAEDEKIRDLAPRISKAYRDARKPVVDPEVEAAWAAYVNRTSPSPDAPPSVKVAAEAGLKLRAKVDKNAERGAATTPLLTDQSPDSIAAESLVVDVFDDVTSPEAAAWMDAEIASLRSDVDADGSSFTATADDGRSLGSLQEILDEIDESDALLREFSKCRTGATE